MVLNPYFKGTRAMLQDEKDSNWITLAPVDEVVEELIINNLTCFVNV